MAAGYRRPGYMRQRNMFIDTATTASQFFLQHTGTKAACTPADTWSRVGLALAALALTAHALAALAFDDLISAFTALATLATLATLTTRPANRSAPAQAGRALRPRGGGDRSDQDGKGGRADDLLLLAASTVRAYQSGDGHGEQSKNMSFRTAPFYVDPQGNTLQTREVTLGNAIAKAVFNVKRNGFGNFAGAQPEIRTSFGPGSWKPDACSQEMKAAVASLTDYELPLVAALARDGTGIKLDERPRFSNPIVRERLSQLSWFKQANQALAELRDAASNFMAGPPRVEAKELQLDDAKWSALFTKAPPRFASLSPPPPRAWLPMENPPPPPKSDSAVCPPCAPDEKPLGWTLDEVLEAPSSSARHRRNTVATEAVLLVMVVLRVAGWHLPSPAANQEASFDILFDVAATLDKENKWWASVPLRALKVKLPSSG